MHRTPLHPTPPQLTPRTTTSSRVAHLAEQVDDAPRVAGDDAHTLARAVKLQHVQHLRMQQRGGAEVGRPARVGEE